MQLQTIKYSLVFSLIALPALAAISTIHGTVTKVDSTTRTIVVKTAEGVEHTLKVAGKTTVHGAETAGKDAWMGLKEGSEVVAHYSTKGALKTATELDKVGGEGLKAVEGTLVKIDKGGKKLVIKAADGTEHTFQVTEGAAETGGKEVAAGAEKAGKVTVYYTEEAGKKVAHFFRRQ